MIRHDNAVEEVGRQGVETGKRETIDQSLDLFGQPPPLLDNNDSGGVAPRGVGEIALGGAAVGTFESDFGAHCFSAAFRSSTSVDGTPNASACPFNCPRAAPAVASTELRSVGHQQDRIERRRAADIEAIALRTAESHVGNDLRDQDLADQLPIRLVAINALAGARPNPSGSVDPEAVVHSVLWRQFGEDLARPFHTLAVRVDAVAAN